MKKILWLILSVIVVLAVFAFVWFVWPGPWVRATLAPAPALVEPTRDPIVVVLAVNQAQQAESLKVIQTQLAQSTMPLVIETEAPVAVAPLVQAAAPIEKVNITTSNGWEINRIDVKKDPIVEAWLSKIKEPSPELWPTFPNVANPKVPDFQVANGAEYGQDDSPFCEYKQTCDWVVPAWHYRLISGDYTFTSPEFSYSCQNVEGQPRKGCLIVLFNVMNETYTWRDQSVDNGFTVMGRYWNGDELQWAVWGLTSHASANMLNLATMRDPTTGNVLNAGGNSANAGTNCGVQPDACGVVDVMVIVHAGDRIFATMHTTVTK